MKKEYEEYSDDQKRRFIIYEELGFYSVILEKYFEEIEIQGYIEPAGFKEIRDGMLHHVGNLEEGIKVGRELLRNI